MIRTFFRYGFYFFIVILLIAIGLFVYGRQQKATPGQLAALEELRKKPKFSESENLAPYLWLLNYDVPADKIDEITAADAKKYNALTSSKSIAEFQSSAASKYPKLDLYPREFDGYCQFRNGLSCLREVSKEKDKISTTLSRLQKEISRVEKVTNYRAHYSPFELHMSGQLPSMSAGENIMRVQRAKLFLDGEQYTAIEKVCGDIAAYRSLSTNSDTLIVAMVSQAYVRNRLSLLADMLTRTDQNSLLPPQCAIAVKPITPEENQLCNAMRGEFNTLENLDVWLSDSSVENVSAVNRIKHQAANFFYDHERTLSLLAPRYAVFCGEEARAAANANTALNISKVLVNSNAVCGLSDRVSNAYGCELLDIAIPSYESYLQRRLDQSAQITAMQILFWLRDKKAIADNYEKLFTERPKNLQAFSDRIRLNRDQGKIEVDLLGPAIDGEKTWGLPLPPSMLANAAQ